MNIIEAIRDDQIFRPLFPNLQSWRVWLVCLKAIFGLSMNRSELKIYRKFTGRTDRPSSPFREAFILSGRRSGKSFISAICAVYLAVFKEWDLGHQRGHIICLAKDMAQAGEVFHYISEILQQSIFKDMIKHQLRDSIELDNRMIISVKSCSFRALRGYQICACIADEVAVWFVEGANPAVETFRAIRPSLGSLKETLLLCITSVYARRGIIYDIHKSKYGKNDKNTLVWLSSTSEMNPSFDKQYIDDALEEDRTVANAEYFSLFREDLEGFFTTREVERVVVEGRESIPPVEGIKYHAFVDPSGGGEGGDNMTLSICHREKGRDLLKKTKIIQDRLVCQKAPFDTDSCVREFSQILKQYGIFEVESDRYAGSWPKQAFEKHSIYFVHSELTKADIYREARALFSSQRLEILDNTLQTNELRGLERKTGRSKDTIDHPPGSSDDCCNSLCGSIVRAVRTDALRLPPPSPGLTEYAETEREDGTGNG